MFDWNDDELSNIIWDEAGESDDHIVPYREAKEDHGTKKDWAHEVNNSKFSEQNPPGEKLNTRGRKLGSSSNVESSGGASASGFGIDSWRNLSLSSTTKTDQDSLDNTSVTNKLTEKAVQFDKDLEIFQKGKEQGHFDDYGWDNIASFDDLDPIFSNDDPIFGSVSLGDADELWPSSKDAISSPGKSFPLFSDSQLGPLGSTSEHFEIKTEYAQEDDQPFTLDYGKMNVPASHGLQNAFAALDHVEIFGAKSKLVLKEQEDLITRGKNVATQQEFPHKVHKQKKSSKSRKRLEQQTNVALYQNSYGKWSSVGNLPDQFKNQFAPTFFNPSPSVLSQPRTLHGHEPLQYHLVSNPSMAPSQYGTLVNTCSTMPVLSHIQSLDFRNQSVLSGYEASSGKPNPVADSPVRTQTMTPQEKIEKLRKRQQMQALIAIQKQQKQFSQQVSCSDQSVAHKFPQENRKQFDEGADLETEDLSNFPAFDPNSPAEQDDSSSMSLAVDDCSGEDTVLYRLQDIVGKMDVRTRLCMRDSLFRLAQSALQRHFTSRTSSNNNSSRDELTKEEISGQNRNVKMSEAETETNPIDRTVAHLLFYRDMSGKHPDTPESPASRKLPSEQRALGTTTSSIGLPEAGKSIQSYSGPSGDSQSTSQYKSSVRIDTSENRSGNADDRAKDVEPSG
ncbi:hypothetical protein M5689_020065 [Euphorbia peplus]|nr:hypothetical protein M5689_020065 [Euphorbia peplus]